MYANIYFAIGISNSFPFVEFSVQYSSTEVFPLPSYCIINWAVASHNADLKAVIK